MDLSNFIKFIQNQPKIPKHIRLYIVSKNHFFINQGTLKIGFTSKLLIEQNRDNVMSVFSKMEFIFDEIIRLRIVGYSNNQNSVELMYLLHLIPVNRKIRTFLDWKLFSPEFARDMSRLFMVRNEIVQSVSLDEVEYNPDKNYVLSEKKSFDVFKKKMNNSWKTLLDVYLSEQEKISWEILSKEIKS